MTDSAPSLRVLDGANLSPELDLVSELFHRINRIIPETQTLLTFPPNMTARDAIEEMRTHGYSQAPVMVGGEVLGVFSYRSFSRKAAISSLEDVQKQKLAPGDLTVDECLEKWVFARVSDEMSYVFEAMDNDNGVLIGEPQRLQGILSPMDFLHYLYKVASPFVLISEIELALRALIRHAVSEKELIECAERSLSYFYGDKVPKTLEDMTLSNCKDLVQYGENWPKFEPIFGGNRILTSAKLKEIVELRNDVFHFKREITMGDHEILSDHRDWLLRKARIADLQAAPGDAS